MLRKLESISATIMRANGILNHIIVTKKGLTRGKLLTIRANLQDALADLETMIEEHTT